MMYEIRTLEKIKGVDKIYRKSYLVSEYNKVNCKKGFCLTFKQDGKKSATYVVAERHSYYEEFEVVVAEATTGKVVERYN